tara:strand:- start:131 stop:307 length:177 start_codon:yes stop_codon:yes gene_type:complete
MSTREFISREQLAKECGFSARTLNRKLKKLKICIPSGYISPDHQEEILRQIGNSRKQN